MLTLCLFGCKEDKKEHNQIADNTVVKAKNEDKKLLYIKCSQFENKRCIGGRKFEESCAGKDENGKVYIEFGGKYSDFKNSERVKLYNFDSLWFFRENFGFDSDETSGQADFIGGNKPCICEKEKEFQFQGALTCRTVLHDGYCYIYIGDGVVDIGGYDIMPSLFDKINVAFGDQDKGPLVAFFPQSRGDDIYRNYINDRFKEYKETVITLFNTIKLGIVLAKNADEFKDYINKAADRFDEYYKLETDNYTYGLHQDEKKIKQLYDNELKRIAKVHKDLLEIVDVYKDSLFMTDEELAQNKLRRMNSFGERDPEADECGRYSL